MKGGCAMVLGMMGMVVLTLIGFNLSEQGRPLWGMLCGGVAFALNCVALAGFNQRAEFEQKNATTLKLTIHSPAGAAIYFWFLMTAGTVVLSFCEWMGWKV